MQEDDEANYQAIWVIQPGLYNPGNFSNGYSKVYSEFSIDPNQVIQDEGDEGWGKIPVDANVIPADGFRVVMPPDGYNYPYYP
jgi:hypothetical protein